MRWSCCTHSCLPAPRLTVIKRWRKRANCECVGKHFSRSPNACWRSKTRDGPRYIKNSPTAFYQVQKSLAWQADAVILTGDNLSWDAAMPIFLEVAFFCMWLLEESTGLDQRLKEMSVNICNTAAHLLLISNNEIPEWISSIPGCSILLNITAEWLVPDQLNRSPNNEVFIFHVIFAAKKN